MQIVQGLKNMIKAKYNCKMVLKFTMEFKASATDNNLMNQELSDVIEEILDCGDLIKAKKERLLELKQYHSEITTKIKEKSNVKYFTSNPNEISG
ncbi:hypothetical protein ECANGB1_783 [Enterospora canceri]|uniref:Uncharacterized protein n=1 Tax=Enterospora canceri TaxID=1081671 RepID=A0A1Y1S8J4_9MICR|nr:hypothetical protein ECANGB1_783 [Enterospora canceri]